MSAGVKVDVSLVARHIDDSDDLREVLGILADHVEHDPLPAHEVLEAFEDTTDDLEAAGWGEHG
jgi:hypothetical protein